jgi:hypothetical protein
MIPEDLRVPYKILKNAGCLPPELELRREIVTLKGLLSAVEEEGEKRPLQLEDFPEYRDRVVEKLTG